MKTRMTIMTFTAVLLGAGCAYNDRYATYEDPPVYSTTGHDTARAASQSTADRALENRIRQQFDRHTTFSSDARNIGITARNGSVTLNGGVSDAYERDAIERMVRGVPGVVAVQNNLSAPRTSAVGYPSTDRALANSVEQALRRQPTIQSFASDIRVDADNGTVTLSGNIPTEADREFVHGIVRNTPGVVGVIDQMRAAPTPTGRFEEPARVYGDAGQLFSMHVQGLNEADRDTAQRVLQGLRTDTVLPTLLPVVNIHVADGKVTLRGTVQDERQRRAIVSSVQRAVGAGNVFDELQLGSSR